MENKQDLTKKKQLQRNNRGLGGPLNPGGKKKIVFYKGNALFLEYAPPLQAENWPLFIKFTAPQRENKN